YRTLKVLTEAGLAREVRFGDNKTYYEHHYNHDHHDHMICTECGKVIEFFSAEIESMQDKAAESFGFKPTHHSLRMWGICSDCQKMRNDLPTAPSGAQPRVKVRSGVGN
ncbi:MAG: transcriptional repressor, partial [Pyrinomonadaceae bacterium]